MKNAPKFALLNFIFIFVNLAWIIAIDANRLSDFSIYSKFVQTWTYLAPHFRTFLIWKVIAISLISLSLLQLFMLKRDNFDPSLATKVSDTGWMLVLNQIFLGLSITAKLYQLTVLSWFLTAFVLISLLIVDRRFKIYEIAHISVIHFLTRITFGIYTGWMVYLLGFNGFYILVTQFHPNETYLFWMAVLFVIFSYSMIVFFALKYKLVALILGYTTGIIGSFYFIKYSVIHPYTMPMLIIFQIIIGISLAVSLWITFQNTAMRSTPDDPKSIKI